VVRYKIKAFIYSKDGKNPMIFNKCLIVTPRPPSIKAVEAERLIPVKNCGCFDAGELKCMAFFEKDAYYPHEVARVKVKVDLNKVT
jgi:hypothetical protein